MERRTHLQRACILSLLALLFLAVAFGVAYGTGGLGAQGRFEVFSDPAQYTAALREAAQVLRWALGIDDLFILAYVGAIGFAALAFLYESPAAAATAGIGALVLGALDFWENGVMGASLDMALAGVGIDADRIAYQVSISTAKWNAAAAALVALTFAIPCERAFEIVLVWTTRLVFPVATALFLSGALDLRFEAAIAILVAKAFGLLLLAFVTYGRSRDGFR